MDLHTICSHRDAFFPFSFTANESVIKPEQGYSLASLFYQAQEGIQVWLSSF